MKQIDKHKDTAFRLLHGKQLNPKVADFSAWLKANALAHINSADRSALLFLASNWEALYPRIPSHMKSPQLIYRWYKAGCPSVGVRGAMSSDTVKPKRQTASEDAASGPEWICGLIPCYRFSWMDDFEHYLNSKARYLGLSVSSLDINKELDSFKRGRGVLGDDSQLVNPSSPVIDLPQM
ncbi:hypothetical protein [Dechloromonas sp.]|uniref:hypothetical protein n=1 Tax=Dechloromonas sp. TaxID=1917218 RepID=UPI00216BBEA8|nr:hypothetical protein [Dechloromonas sp.]MBU3696768.1 hypothetical protein [Dechloromonas sp.]